MGTCHVRRHMMGLADTTEAPLRDHQTDRCLFVARARGNRAQHSAVCWRMAVTMAVIRECLSVAHTAHEFGARPAVGSRHAAHGTCRDHALATLALSSSSGVR